MLDAVIRGGSIVDGSGRPLPVAPPPEPHPLEGLTAFHMDPLTGENSAEAGFLPEGLDTDQRVTIW